MTKHPHPSLFQPITAAAIAASALIPFAHSAAAQEVITPILNPPIESTNPFLPLQHPPRYTLRPGEKPLNILVFDFDTPSKDRNHTHGSGFVIPAIMRTLGAPRDDLYRVAFYDLKDFNNPSEAIESALKQNETITAANFSFGWNFEYGAMSRILSEYTQESTTVTKDNLADHSSTILRLIEDGNVEQYRQMLQFYYQENGLSPNDAKKRVDTDLYALQDTKRDIPLLRNLADRAGVGIFIATGNIDSTKEFKLYSLIQHSKISHVASLQRSIEPRDAFPQIAYQTALNTAATLLGSAVTGHFTPLTLSQPIKTNGAVNSNTTTLAGSYFLPKLDPSTLKQNQQQLLERALATSKKNNELFATPAQIRLLRQNSINFSAYGVIPTTAPPEKLYPVADIMDLHPKLRADLAGISQPHNTWVLLDKQTGRFMRTKKDALVLFSQADDGSLRATTKKRWAGTSLAAPMALARTVIQQKFIATDVNTALHYAAATKSALDIRRPPTEPLAILQRICMP